ncbi:MAG: VOC family protein [Gemmatimonadales bacterium]
MAARKKASKKKSAAKKASGKPASKRATAKKPAARRSANASAKKSARKSAKKAAKAAAPRRREPETLRLRSVTPGLTVGDLQKSLAWYRDVMGFHVGELWKENGEVRGAEIMAGAARFYLGQDDWAKGRDRKKGEGFRLSLTTAQSVDAIAAAIEQRGGKLDSQPMDMPWGTRAFALTDPDGFKLTISSGE